MNVKFLKPPFSRPLTIEELAALPDETIDYSDIPETDAAFWANATVSFGLPKPKSSVTIRYDADIIEWFKANTGTEDKRGKGYQTAMNAVLRSYVEAQKAAPKKDNK
jgi:uncharacterized protein (DUF4415 family)